MKIVRFFILAAAHGSVRSSSVFWWESNMQAGEAGLTRPNRVNVRVVDPARFGEATGKRDGR